MRITFDPVKRAATLSKRNIDFLDAAQVFADRTFTMVDDRFDYGEVRFVTTGLLRGSMVVIVWVKRGSARRIISMRKANDREQARYRPRLD